MRKRLGRRTVLVLMLALATLGWAPPATQAASSFANPAFQTQWSAGEALTQNFWGPLSTAKDGQQEPYQEASGGQRLVQYFDKGHMELTNGTVTNGLLATEIVKGQIQIGDAAFQPKSPPAIPIAGDPDNAGPTYAALGTTAAFVLAAAHQAPVGSLVGTVVAPDGTIAGGDPNDGPAAVRIAAFDSATQHNVPQAFADYRTKAGVPTIGYAISEPFYANVKVAGKQRSVLVQVFERRVLTYTASNDPAFQVEMGNIGQHYYQWRYSSGTTASAPTATQPAPSASTTTPPTGVLGNTTNAPIRPGMPPVSGGA